MSALGASVPPRLQSPRVAPALENGAQPVICEGWTEPASSPRSADVIGLFRQKYGWRGGVGGGPLSAMIIPCLNRVCYNLAWLRFSQSVRE